MFFTYGQILLVEQTREKYYRLTNRLFYKHLIFKQALREFV